MNSDTQLHRIIRPEKTNHKENRPNSDCFNMSRGQDGVSVYDGTNLSAEEAFKHWTEVLEYAATGVVTITVGDCQELKIEVKPDPKPDSPHHTLLIPPETRTPSQRNAILRLLHRKAKETWSYQPPQE